MRRTLRRLFGLAIGLGLAITLQPARTATAADSERASGLRVVGSGYTMPALLELWTSGFTEGSGTPVRVVGTGTSTGPPALLEGQADLAAMTRPLRDAEATALRKAFGHPALEVPIAQDALAVFVNDANPIDALTMTQVDAIFSKTRRCGGGSAIDRWDQLGLEGEFARRRITLFGRRAGSGTGSLFRSMALCGGEFHDWLRTSPGRKTAALRVATSRFGIGFGSLRDRVPGMKAVRLAARTGAPPHSPQDGFAGADYPLMRRLNLVIAPHECVGPNDPRIVFLRHVLAVDAQDRVRTTGFEPLPEGLRRGTLESIDAFAATHACDRDDAVSGPPRGAGRSEAE